MTRSNPYRSTATKIAVGTLAAAVLLFAPSAAFAQRGGGGGGHMGGGGGGGHFGGGGGFGGGSHAPASHSAAKPPTRSAPVAQSRPPVVAPARTGSASTGGTTNAVTAHPSLFGTPATSGPAAGLALHNESAAPRTTVIGFPPSESHTWQSAPTHSGPMSFSGQGHDIWQDSPSRSGNNVVTTAPAGTNRSLFSTKSAPTTVIRPMPHIGFQPRPRPIIFFPAYGYFGNGFGCDPFFGWGFNSGFGCNGFGYGYGFGYGGGLGYGAYYGSGFGYGSGPGYDDSSTTVDASPDAGYGPYSSTNLSQESLSELANGGPASSDSSASAAVNAAPTATTIYLKDGTSYEVMSYWLDAGKLHYITNYGGETSIDMSQLDLQRTVDENALRGGNFTLRPAPAAPAAPASNNATPSSSTDSAAPPAPQQ